MEKKTMRRVVILLAAVSVAIYVLQILIFRDSRNTFFYIFQDFAFMPITIAIATLVVGDLMNEHEKRERMEKTRMLTSSFYTNLGAEMMLLLLARANYREELEKLLYAKNQTTEDTAAIQAEIQAADTGLTIDEESYETVRRIVMEKQTGILVLASNPMLLEHECFTEMLWGVFHLMDEFRLRGSYQDLKTADIAHMEDDMQKELKLLMINWISNARYIRETYPNFYMAARLRMNK